MRAPFLVLPLALASLGCIPINPSADSPLRRPIVTADVTRLAGRVYPPRAADAEVAVLAGRPAQRPHEDLGLLTVQTDMGTFTPKTLSVMLPTLCAKARELGADAIVVLNVEPGGAPTWTKYNSQTPAKAFAVAIRYLAP